jgi:hypothetical protein
MGAPHLYQFLDKRPGIGRGQDGPSVMRHISALVKTIVSASSEPASNSRRGTKREAMAPITA